MKRHCSTIVLSTVGIAFAGCGGGPLPIQPGPALATVTLTYEAPTTLRGDLPASVQSCVQGATPTHTHPSWRGFAFVPLVAAASDRWQAVFDDVPTGVLLSLRINDANVCDENATGAVTRNIFINGVRLTTATLTPGSGQEPGFSFRVGSDGQIEP